ncbi:hypothetical protein U5640_36335 [Streptomyces sp. SS7]|uniref:hypothetical protein n=1 Tax=Streptomyces sp. SS7 TaxID=3108485 RepID=UPI0030EE6F93
MDRFDVLVLLGVLLVCAGLCLLAPWLGLTVAGALVLGVGLVGAVAREKADVTRELIKTQGGER